MTAMLAHARIEPPIDLAWGDGPDAGASRPAPMDAGMASLIATIQQVFAAVTRFPPDLLTARADLEEELGIDSVKLGEALSALRERLGLGDRIGATPEERRSIAGIAQAVARIAPALAGGARPAPVPAVPAAPVQAATASPVPAAPAAAGADLEAIIATIREVFATVTRFPPDLLTAKADLEEELGIDSVKLGEALSALRERLGLGDRIGATAEERRSLAGIAQAVARAAPALAAARPAAPVQAAPVHAAPVLVPAAASAAPLQTVPAASVPAAVGGDPHSLIATIQEVFAEVTRYPLDMLTAEADLEEELGIDSVKLGEALSALRNRLGIEGRIGATPEERRSIAGIAQAVIRFNSTAAAAQPGNGSEPAAPAAAASPADTRLLLFGRWFPVAEWRADPRSGAMRFFALG